MYQAEEANDFNFDPVGEKATVPTSMQKNINQIEEENHSNIDSVGGNAAVPTSKQNVLEEILPSPHTQSADTFAILRVCSAGLERVFKYAEEVKGIIEPYVGLSEILAILFSVGYSQNKAEYERRIKDVLKSEALVGAIREYEAKSVLVWGLGAHRVTHDHMDKDVNDLGQFVYKRLRNGVPIRDIYTEYKKADPAVKKGKDAMLELKKRIQKTLKRDYHGTTNKLFIRRESLNDVDRNVTLGGEKVILIIEDLKHMINNPHVTAFRFSSLRDELARLMSMSRSNLRHLKARFHSRIQNAKWRTGMRARSIINADKLSPGEIQVINEKLRSFLLNHEHAPRLLFCLQLGFNFKSVTLHNRSTTMDTSYCALAKGRMKKEDYKSGIRAVQEGFAWPAAMDGHTFRTHVSLSTARASLKADRKMFRSLLQLTTRDYARDVSNYAIERGLMTRQDFDDGIRCIQRGDRSVTFAVKAKHGLYTTVKKLQHARDIVETRKRNHRSDYDNIERTLQVSNVPPTQDLRIHLGDRVVIRARPPKVDKGSGGKLKGTKATKNTMPAENDIYMPEILALFIVEKDALRRGKPGKVADT